MTNRSGFTVVEILLVMSIFGILALVSSELLLHMDQSMATLKSKQEKISYDNYIADIIQNQNGMRQSAALQPANKELYYCVEGGTLPTDPTCSGNCCKGDQSFDFTLLDPADFNPDLSLRQKLIGPSQSPIFYSKDSQVCLAEGNCAYSISGSFKAHCPGGAATCDHAEGLQVTLNFQPTPGNETKFKKHSESLYYFVKLNYAPFLQPIPDQTLSVGQVLKIMTVANAGHPSEDQSFIWNQCDSSDINIAQAKCYGFVNAAAAVEITGIAPGVITLKLRIDDLATEKNLSPVIDVKVTVTP